MNKILTKKQALIYPVWLIAIIVILTIFPLRLYDEEILMKDSENFFGETQYCVETGNPISQGFIAQYDHLDSLEFWVNNRHETDQMRLRITDEEGKVIRDHWYLMGTTEGDTEFRWVEFPVNIDLEVGKIYTVALEGIYGEYWFRYETNAASGVNYYTDMRFDVIDYSGFNLATRFHYMQPLRKKASLFMIAGIALITALYTACISMLAKKKTSLQELVTAQWAVTRFGNPLLAVATLGAMIAIGPMHLFGKMIINMFVLEVGVILLALTLFYAMNHKRTGDDSFITWEYITDHIGDLLQMIFVAYGIWACINYMNGLYDVHHDIAYRQMLVFLGLSVIATYNHKEILNWYNPILLIVSAIAARTYYVQNLPLMESEFHATALKWTCYLAVIIVMIAVNTICILGKRQIRSISPIYAICTAIMAAAVIIMRNTRGWPIMMVVAFSLYAIRYAAWEKKERLLPILCNGILLNFIGCTIYCWLHRPYLAYVYFRYPHMFFTVTETATYLAMIYGAALAKLLWKWHRKGTLKACYKEAILYGVVVSYILFTMSRTAFFAVGAVTIVMLLVTIFIEKGTAHFGKTLGKTIGVICLSVVWAFPITFMVQRTIPALVVEPKAYEIEQFPAQVLIGEEIDSNEYMSFGRFVDSFLAKVLHAPSDFLNLDRFEFAKADYEMMAGPYMASMQDNLPYLAVPQPGASYYYDDYEDDDFTNGRTDIFQSYWEQMTWNGHDEMGALLQDGSIAAHAHNIYLQVAFDHGMIVGMIFILWVIATMLRSLQYYLRHRGENSAAILPFACIISFAVAGMAEWITHPCNPAGFILLLVIAPLIFDGDSKKKHGRK